MATNFVEEQKRTNEEMHKRRAGSGSGEADYSKKLEGVQKVWSLENNSPEKTNTLLLSAEHSSKSTNGVEKMGQKTIQAIGSDERAYYNKLRWLQKVWKPQSDSPEKRIISPLLYSNVAQIDVAIIADNLEFFEKNYEVHCKEQLDVALNIACMCGSQKIGKFLLEKLNSSKSPVDMQNILSYVAASQNIAWAEEIAIQMSQGNHNMPDSINRLSSSYEMLNTIQKAFKVNISKTLPM